MRLWPKSLLGQVLLTVALALLVAQSVSATLLFRAAENRREQAVLNAAAFRLVAPAGPRSFEARRGGARRGIRPPNRGGPGPRPLRLETTGASPVQSGEVRKIEMEAEIRTILAREGVAVQDIIILIREAANDPFVQTRPRLLRRLAQRDEGNASILVAALRVPDTDTWQVARVPIPKGARAGLTTIILQTLVLYVVLVGLLFVLLRRMTRPLAQLTKRTEAFGHSDAETDVLEPSGPEDVRRLMIAHNSMEARIAGLLSEKDVMLGAIGHDLKTPLAALRVRIESVEDEQERSKMASSIVDITQTLDDILTLARVGKAQEPPERAELSALLVSVVEEFEDRGKPVTIGTTERVVHRVYITWLKRAIRNLVSNAVRYGQSAEISLIASGNAVIIRVDDHGPGIAPDRIAEMLEPFTRGEASRNRDTGGAGLGLTITQAIVHQHGGELEISNRSEGGLRCDLRLPLV